MPLTRCAWKARVFSRGGEFEGRLLSAACAALLLASLRAPAAFAQAGAVVLQPIGSGDMAPAIPGVPQFDFTMRPSPTPAGTERLDFNVACVLLPSETIVPNCDITVTWLARNGSGGHVHNTNRPPGRFRTQNGVIGGWTNPQTPNPPAVVMDNSGATGLLGLTYNSPEPSGVTDFTGRGVAVVNGQIVFFGPNTFTIGIQIDNLLLASGAGLAVDTSSNMHDSNNGNALQNAIDALQYMAQDFANTLTRQGRPVPPVRVTALSLPLGGIFDFQIEWRPPHSGHRLGNEADIGMCEMTRQQLTALALAVTAAGFGTPYGNESPGQDVCGPGGHRHWHLVR
jgi:hypothetical protein